MFLGHYALGLAAKRLEPRLTLPQLLFAPQLLDLIWPVLVLAGVEHVEVAPGNTAFTPLAFTSYPWSHSLLMACVYGLVLCSVWHASGAGLLGGTIGFLLVVSHWVLDFFTHRPDMPLTPWGSTHVGLGLWNSVPATLVVELILYAAGLLIYVRATRPRDRTGTWSFVALAAFLLAAYLGNVLGPPPPSAKAVAASALLLWLIPLWGVWIERHRKNAERA